MATNARRGVRLAAQVGLSTLLTVVFASWVGLSAGAGSVSAQDPGKKADDGPAKAEPPKVKLGLHLNDPRALAGYTLLAPMNAKNVYLLDNEGRVVHRWKFETNSSHCCY